MNSKFPTRDRRAFGLSEVLVVVAIVGVLAAIAIPALSGILRRADTEKVARNRQAIVSTFNAARAAGNMNDYADVAEAVLAITTSPGLTGQGQFEGSPFYVPLSTTERNAALTKISAIGSGENLTLGIVP